ncbi:MAG: class I SAM-dependent methyltransferase [Nitrospirae bacterium]|nr:class I SAM-dependent methyltransferase [Nitrospirota bacterium]
MLYKEHILPRIIDIVMNNDRHKRLRAESLKGLKGSILEIGFGSGLNLPYYPPDVEKVYALDPSKVAIKLAVKRFWVSHFPVEFIGVSGEEIPMQDNSVDAVVTAWTLCTIPNPDKALKEMKRVLKPGGTYRFIEHGLADDTKVAMWQDRLNGIQNAIGGGCNMNRKIDDLVSKSGFKIENLDKFYVKGPKVLAYTYKGSAVKDTI